MKKTKFYVGICLVVQCVCFAVAALILWGQKKSLAKALLVTAGIGGISGVALISFAIKEKKKLEKCCEDCLEDFDDDFFLDDEEDDDVLCVIDDDAAEVPAN
jgi:hypothetical protein